MSLKFKSMSKRLTPRQQCLKERRLRRRHSRQQNLNCCDKPNEDQEWVYETLPIYDSDHRDPIEYKVVRRRKYRIIVVYER